MFKEKSSKNKVIDTLKGLYPIAVWQAVTIGVTAVMGAIFVLYNVNDLSSAFDESFVEEIILKNSLTFQLMAYIVLLPILLIIAYFRVKKAKEENAVISYKTENILKYIFIIFFAVFVMYTGNIFVSIFDIFAPSSFREQFEEINKYIYNAPFWIQIVAAGLLGPIIEEVVFRFFMYGSLRRAFGKFISAFATSVVFGIMHGNIEQGIYAFLLSFAFIFVYEKYKNIAAPILAHISANTVGLIITRYVNKLDVAEQRLSVNQVPALLISFLFFLLFTLGFGALIYFFVNPKKK